MLRAGLDTGSLPLERGQATDAGRGQPLRSQRQPRLIPAQRSVILRSKRLAIHASHWTCQQRLDRVSIHAAAAPLA